MKHNKTAVFWTAAIMAAVLFALLAMPWIQQTHGGALVERIDHGWVVDGVTVEGQSLGGLTYEEARKTLSAWIASQSGEELVLTYCGREERISLAAIGVSWDLDRAVYEAMTLGREGGILSRMEPSYTTVPLRLSYGTEQLHNAIAKTVAALNLGPIEPRAVPDPDDSTKLVFQEGAPGVIPDEEALCAAIERAVQQRDFTPIAVPGEERQPLWSLEEIKANTQRRAVFSTFYRCESQSDWARHYNINLMCEYTNGAVIGPGEVFSLNDAVGPRTDPRIWASAPGLMGGTAVDQLGGGICQYSTTLFNCAVLADLVIEERSPHSIPPAYVEKGRDSMINSGGPDLKLRNPTDYPMVILAQTQDDGQGQKRVTVELYGPTMGHTVSIESRVVRELPHTTVPEEVEDPGQVAPARKGYETELFAVYRDATGAVIKRQLIAKSTYYPAPQRILRSPASTPTPSQGLAPENQFQ